MNATRAAAAMLGLSCGDDRVYAPLTSRVLAKRNSNESTLTAAIDDTDSVLRASVVSLQLRHSFAAA